MAAAVNNKLQLRVHYLQSKITVIVRGPGSVTMEDPEWRLGAAGTRSMDETAFAKYAEHLEMEDFESDLYRICCSIRWDE